MIISVLLLVIVAVIFMHSQMYSIKYDLRESEANRKAKQYKELLEEYRVAEDINIGEFSLNVKRDRERLQEKIERYWRRWMEAE